MVHTLVSLHDLADGSAGGGGVTSGSVVVDTHIHICPVTVMCDHTWTATIDHRPFTESIFHSIRGDRDLFLTNRHTQHAWCSSINITYQWVRGQSY
jgi:hypothetical protein